MKFIVRKYDFFFRETPGGHWVATSYRKRASRFSTLDAASKVASAYPDAFVEPVRSTPKEAIS